MEQRADDPTPDEIEVAKILAELARLILESGSRPRFPFSWGAKKKRSVPGQDDTPTPSLPPAKSPPQARAAEAVSPSLTRPVLVVAPTKKAAEASSPTTPLSFLPSESEEKPKPPKKNYSLKRRREEQLQLIGELSQRKQLLQKEVENVRSYYNKLKSCNLGLKARKQELISSATAVMKGEVWLAETEFGQPSPTHHRQQLPPLFYQQPFIMNPTVQVAHMSETTDKSSQFPHGQSSSSSLEGVRDKVGPTGIPDLNVSLEEEELALEYSEPFDLNRARAAQARLKRMQICKMKNSTASCKPRAMNR